MFNYIRFSDLASSINIVKAKGGSILLTDNKVSDKDRDYVNKVKDIYTVGGKNTVSEDIVKKLFRK